MLGKIGKWKQVFGRSLLYAQLVERFGAYQTWGHKAYPKGKREEYEIFLYDFASVMTILSGDATTSEAVRMQIRYAITTQEYFKTSAVVYNHIVNFMAAYVSGFITNKDFPDTILMDKEL